MEFLMFFVGLAITILILGFSIGGGVIFLLFCTILITSFIAMDFEPATREAFFHTAGMYIQFSVYGIWVIGIVWRFPTLKKQFFIYKDNLINKN